MSVTKEPLATRPIQLCAFDTSRDYPEGEEARQILAYHPADCCVDDQISVVGLAQALLTFTGNFDEACTRSLFAVSWASNSLCCVSRCRMQVATACMPSETYGCSQGLQAILHQAYVQYSLLHGSLREKLVRLRTSRLLLHCACKPQVLDEVATN